MGEVFWSLLLYNTYTCNLQEEFQKEESVHSTSREGWRKPMLKKKNDTAFAPMAKTVAKKGEISCVKSLSTTSSHWMGITQG